MKNKTIQNLSILSFILLLASCASNKKIQYFQEVEGVTVKDTLLNFEPIIEVGDMLSINVSATDAEAALPFNLYETPMVGTSIASAKPLTYLVNIDGEINFPVLGKYKVGGFTTKQLTANLGKTLGDTYINDPIINVRLTNFKVSVVGEVKRPGSFVVTNERISILEALSLAGDLTIHGKRKNVLLIREIQGKKEFVTLDLTNKEVFNSPYYYLKQNDVVYVAPNKSKVNSSAVGANTGVIVSSVSLLIALMALILN